MLDTVSQLARTYYKVSCPKKLTACMAWWDGENKNQRLGK
jgi:hypothetical protein